MKSCAVICEFNLFHNGHAALMRRRKGEEVLVSCPEGEYKLKIVSIR